MTWLRIDDGFALHPKIVQLTDRQFRLWMRLLCWCARYQTKGIILPAALAEFRVRGSDLEDFGALGLVETDEDRIVVHDWNVYAPKDPTGAERKRRERDKNRDPDRDTTVTDTLTPPRGRDPSSSLSKEGDLALSEPRPESNGQGFEIPELRSVS